MDINTLKNKYIGKRFGHLVIKDIVRNNYHSFALCVCDCGVEKQTRLDHLISGSTKSCGCQQHKNRKPTNVIHSSSKTRLYCIWIGMKQRCFNKNHNEFNRYGGRGITVCKEWLDFSVFKKWAKTHGYADNLTIERVDVNGDYCEQNCRWIPLSEQLKNTSRSVFITFNGETLCANDWCKRFGLPNNSVIRRYRKGLPLEEVFKLNTKKE